MNECFILVQFRKRRTKLMRQERAKAGIIEVHLPQKRPEFL